MPCMNLTKPLEICMPPGQMGEKAWPHHPPCHWPQGRSRHGICRDRCRIGLPLGTPSFPAGTHDYDPKRHDHIEWISRCMISSIVKHKDHMMIFTLMATKWVVAGGHQPQFPVWWGNLPPTVKKPCQTTAPSLQLRLQPSLWHLSIPTHWSSPSWCSSLLWLNVLFAGNWWWRFWESFNLSHYEPALVIECWIPSYCGIEGNERLDQLTKETLDQDTHPLASIHYTYLKPLVNFCIQPLVQTKWDVAVEGRDLYLEKPTLGHQRNSST